MAIVKTIKNMNNEEEQIKANMKMDYEALIVSGCTDEDAQFEIRERYGKEYQE